MSCLLPSACVRSSVFDLQFVCVCVSLFVSVQLDTGILDTAQVEDAHLLPVSGFLLSNRRYREQKSEYVMAMVSKYWAIMYSHLLLERDERSSSSSLGAVPRIPVPTVHDPETCMWLK